MRKPKFLNRYLKVERDELPARFRIVKSIPVDFDPSAPVEDLWEVHDSEIGKYREVSGVTGKYQFERKKY